MDLDLKGEPMEKYKSYYLSLPLFFDLPPTGDALFDRAIQTVFHHEGFYSNDKDDPGGPTVWGWSLRTAKQLGDLDGDGFLDLDLDGDGDVDHQDILELRSRPDLAITLYKKVFWDPHRYKLLPPDIAIKSFDLAVNMGSSQANKLLQRSVRACGKARLVDDGLLGPASLKALSAQSPDALLAAYRSHAAGFYQLLAAQRPKSRKYLAGWLNRAYF